MGNFEKLSVLVIVVIIVMILVVALYTWTGDPATTETTPESDTIHRLAVNPDPGPATTPGTAGSASNGQGSGWEGWSPPKPENEGTNTGGTAGTTPGTTTTDPDDGTVKPVPADPKNTTTASTTTNGTTAASTTPVERTYVVKRGDSYTKIAVDQLHDYGSWKRIMELNGIAPEKLREGMTLRLPGAAASSTRASAGGAVATTGSVSPGSTYVVKHGDDLKRIARLVFRDENRWDDIWLENLAILDDPSSIREGMTIQLPAQ